MEKLNAFNNLYSSLNSFRIEFVEKEIASFFAYYNNLINEKDTMSLSKYDNLINSLIIELSKQLGKDMWVIKANDLQFSYNVNDKMKSIDNGILKSNKKIIKLIEKLTKKCDPRWNSLFQKWFCIYALIYNRNFWFWENILFKIISGIDVDINKEVDDDIKNKIEKNMKNVENSISNSGYDGLKAEQKVSFLKIFNKYLKYV